jgi:hypothetical protein
VRGERAHRDGFPVGDVEAMLLEQLEKGRELEARLDDLRRRIPTFRCIQGCHDCCGPVTASAAEVARLPARPESARASALRELDCVHLGPHGCQVYDERPLIRRLFGTTPRRACPTPTRPVYMIDARTEAEIEQFHARTRQVLL